MTVSKTRLHHINEALRYLTLTKAFDPYRIELHIGTGLLFELADEIIATCSSLNGPPLTYALIKEGNFSLKEGNFSLYNARVIPSLALGPNFEIRLLGGPTTTRD